MFTGLGTLVRLEKRVGPFRLWTLDAFATAIFRSTSAGSRSEAATRYRPVVSRASLRQGPRSCLRFHGRLYSQSQAKPTEGPNSKEGEFATRSCVCISLSASGFRPAAPQ